MKRTSLRMDGLQISCTVYSNHNTATYNLWLKKKKINNWPESSHDNSTISDILYILPYGCKEEKKKEKTPERVLHFSWLWKPITFSLIL